MEPTQETPIMNYDTEQPSFWSKLSGGIIELIEFIAIVGAILVIVRFFIAEPHKVSGHSMVNNFQDGDYIITNKLSLRFSDPQRGEVVILKNPRNTDQVFIKRVIGLPLEHIKISNGKFYINGQQLLEPYLPNGLQTPGGAYLSEEEEITIPEDQYFVAGDNRNGSSDSREWGSIKKELIIGQAWLRYWPIGKFTLLKINTPSI